MAVGLDIVFIHSARTSRDIIFHDELTHLQTELPSLRLSTSVKIKASIPIGPVGRLDLARLHELVPDLRNEKSSPADLKVI
jgi:ferredoxin-NADP reductase